MDAALPPSSAGLNLWTASSSTRCSPSSQARAPRTGTRVPYKPSRTLCATRSRGDVEPPPILTSEPEYTLLSTRATRIELVADTPAARLRPAAHRGPAAPLRPGSAVADLGLGPVLAAARSPSYELGWGGWLPIAWRSPEAEAASFDAFSANGKPTLLPIIQIILSRGNSGEATQRWVDKVTSWDFERVVPAHLDAPLAIGPKQFAEPFAFIRNGRNEVRFCDEDVKLLRDLENGVLSFSVFKSELGVLRGARSCGLV